MPDPHIPMKRLQSADKLLGWLACSLLQPLRLLRRPPPSSGRAQRVLLIKFWGIGSLQLLTPAARVLRARHPSARLVLLTLRENEAFARSLGVFDELVTLDVRSGGGVGGWTAIFARILRLVHTLRRARFDRVYDFEFFTRFSSLVSVATGARAIHGFAAPRVWRGRFHTHTVPFNRYWHVARNFRALAGGEDGSEVGPADLVAASPRAEDRESARQKLAELGFAPRGPYVVLNPNAGRLSLERRWPPASFAELARSLIDEDGMAVVLVGSSGEAGYVAAIAREIGARRPGELADLSGRLSIGELCALLAQAAAVVTNDSGPMHLAAALGVPTVGLFGPETPVMYGPLGERAVGLWKPPACSPCINVHENKVANCIHGRPECLVNLGVEDVLAETRLCLWDGVLHPVVPFTRRERAQERIAAANDPFA